jgi:6-phosphogluconolactonase
MTPAPAISSTAEAMGREVAAAFARVHEEAVAKRGAVRVALTGGSSARLVYPLLRGAALDGSKTHVYFGDERAVAADHADSNYALARALWLGASRIPEDQIHRMPADVTDLEAGARAYEETLGETPLDLVHLGLGPDGHVASLFPGHALLRERTRRVATLTDSPKPPPRRMTLTLRALREARLVCITAAGADKAEAVSRITERGSDLPGAIVFRECHAALYLDAAAAARIQGDAR